VAPTALSIRVQRTRTVRELERVDVASGVHVDSGAVHCSPRANVPVSEIIQDFLRRRQKMPVEGPPLFPLPTGHLVAGHQGAARERFDLESGSTMVPNMSEGILLPPVARGTLLPTAERVARLEQALPQIRAALDGERDAVAIEATLACLLWQTLTQTNWCGFYRRVADRMLAVGPYQGAMGCLRIDFDRGVCGACARTREIQLVPDVAQFPDHIACDDRTRSELVLPVIAGGELRAVLDLDSPHLDAFAPAEAELLRRLLDDVFANATF
jgi:GAF domain-containing protein